MKYSTIFSFLLTIAAEAMIKVFSEKSEIIFVTTIRPQLPILHNQKPKSTKFQILI